MSDSKRPPIIESKGCDSNQGLVVNVPDKASVPANDTVHLARIIKRSDLYCSKLNQMPVTRRPEVDSICDGDELLICEFSSILKDFGSLGMEIVLNFADIYQRPDNTAHIKLGEIVIIRAVIKTIRNFAVEMLASGDAIMEFLKNIAGSAHCQDLRQLTDLMIQVQYLIQQSRRCACLDRALTIHWDYMELLVFLDNYRCVMSLHGSVVAGEQMRAYMQSAQGDGISRNFLN